MEQNIYQKRLATILSRIAADPSCWWQMMWHCDTAHCLAGHAQIDAGLPPNGATAAIDGAEWLGMSQAVADWAFYRERTLDDLRSLLSFDVAGEYSPDGFDCDGYDREGYDRRGLGLDGYDRDGFDYYGVDRNGYARLVLAIGFDRIGPAHNSLKENS
jgi:hypothetical protein